MRWTLSKTGAYVRHRIDGLEINATLPLLTRLVRHRIDGLEIVALQ